MKPLPTILFFLLMVTVWMMPTVAEARTLQVTTQEEFREAVKGAIPGDVIRLANGTWNDFEILFTGKGTADQPITLTAEEKGKVIISGRSNLRMAGEYLVVSGLVFRNGHTPTSEVISFRRNKDDLAHHSRITEVVIDEFNNPERTETDFWVIMYGRHNRFDHNHLSGKSNKGVTMAVRLNTEQSRENHHRIDHNYFGVGVPAIIPWKIPLPRSKTITSSVATVKWRLSPTSPAAMFIAETCFSSPVEL